MMRGQAIFSRVRQEEKATLAIAAAALVACGAIGTERDPAATHGPSGGSAGASVAMSVTAGGGDRQGSSSQGSGGAFGGGGAVTTSGSGSAGAAGGAGAGGTGGGVDAGPPVVPGMGCGAMSNRVFAGNFDDTSWLVSWDPGAHVAFGESNLERIADATFGMALRVHYPAGSVNPDAMPVGGTQFKARIRSGATDSICLSYWLRFDSKFQFVKGGKLPGLCGGNCPSGGDQTNGRDGWAARYMWRERGAGEVYAYVLPALAFGTELGEGKWTFVQGAWHHLEELITLNTPGQKDGSVSVWYDRMGPADPPDYQVKNVEYRTVATLRIDQIFFSTFFGGQDPTWATPVDTYVDFAHFELFE